MLDYIVDNEQYFLGKDKNGQPHYIKEVQDIVLKILLEIDPNLEVLTVDHEELPKVI